VFRLTLLFLPVKASFLLPFSPRSLCLQYTLKVGAWVTLSPKHVEPQQSLPHVRWYLQHKDGHVVTCQPKAWMDTEGFAMRIDLVLGPWWQTKKIACCWCATMPQCTQHPNFNRNWTNTASFYVSCRQI